MPLWRYLEAGGKRAAAVWHRRAGKDDVALHWTATQAIQRQANYWHMLPQFNQARRAIWEAVNAHTGKRRIEEAFPKEIRARTNEHDMFIEFVNGSTWRVVGSDNFDALVGAGPLGIVFSEWSLSNPRAWLTLAPILEENGGWSLFIYTPRGRNHGLDLLEMARKSAEWHASVLPATETPIFTTEQLARIKAEYEGLFPGVGEDMFEQEYNCDFSAAMPGAYFAKLIEKADVEGRIAHVPHRTDLPVHTAWDLGIGDDTSIWFVQRVAGWLHVIDHYATNGQPASHYVEVLNRKPYIYAGHILPHDADAREWSNGFKRIDTLKSLGLKDIRVLDRIPVDDGINAVRLTLPQCRFDKEKCKQGLESLRQYRREYDEDRRVFKPTPLHDFSSHDCLVGETVVETTNGPKRLDTIVVGDMVATPAGPAMVTAAGPVKMADELIELRLSTGATLLATPEHKILTARGVVRTADLEETDVLLTGEELLCRRASSRSMDTNTGFRDAITAATCGRFASALNAVASFVRHTLRGPSSATRIVSKRRFAVGGGGRLVYDLTVAKHHCYKANGVLVSNSDAFRYLATGLKPEAAIPPEIPAYYRGRRNAHRGGSNSWMSA